MNQYKRLMSNTVVFAIGTFSSKMLVFFMTRFYTGILTTGEYGTIDVITSIANVLIPIASLSIPSAVIRYGLEKSENKHEIFSVGFFTILAGFLITLPFAPLLGLISDMQGYLLLVYLYVLSSCMQTLCGQFVRSRGYVKLYALDGIFRTAVMIGFNVLFLRYLELGITGYILSIILSDALSALCLFGITGMGRFLHIRALNPRTTRRMLAYSIPLIPTTICVWIFSMSDRLFIRYMVDAEANGLYSLANKLPTILVLVSGIFIEAWQISTINNNSEKEQVQFFSTVGNVYQVLVFFMASGIILFSKPAVYILAGSPDYYEAWRFIPLLVFGSSFACLSNFQNSIYTLKKRTIYSLITALIGAGMNIVLNALLIPVMGANGAALATLTSYIAMFLMRAIHSRKFLVVRWNVVRFISMFALLCLQSALMLHHERFWLPTQILLFLVIALIGSGQLLMALRKILKKG